MSLVRCPKCGHAASDDSIRCSFCGQVLKPEIVEAEEAERRARDRAEAEAERARRAEEQKSSVIQEENTVPEQTAAEETANAGRTGRSKKKKGKGPKIFIIFLILAVIACAGYWFMSNRDTADDLEDSYIEEPVELEEDSADGVTDEGSTEDDGVIVDNGEEQPADGEEFYEPAEDGGTDDNGAQGGQNVTDDDPFAEED